MFWLDFPDKVPVPSGQSFSQEINESKLSVTWLHQQARRKKVACSKILQVFTRIWKSGSQVLACSRTKLRVYEQMPWVVPSPALLPRGTWGHRAFSNPLAVAAVERCSFFLSRRKPGKGKRCCLPALLPQTPGPSAELHIDQVCVNGQVQSSAPAHGK